MTPTSQMASEPSDILIGCVSAAYFVACLWLVIATGQIHLNGKVRRLFKVSIAALLGLCGLGGLYLFVVAVSGSLALAQTPLFALILLVIVPLPSMLFDASPPMRRSQRTQRIVARAGLAYLLVVITVSSLLLIAPVGGEVVGWFAALVQAKPVLFAIMAGFAIGIVLATGLAHAGWQTVLSAVLWLVLILAATTVIIIAVLIRVAYSA